MNCNLQFVYIFPLMVSPQRREELYIPATSELWLSLVLIAGVLVLCFYLSRFIAKKMGGNSSGKLIKIIERVAFSQDKCLVIAKICDDYYLIGVAPQNIKILARLDPAHFVDDKMVEVPPNLFEFIMKKSPKKPNDTNNQT